MYRKERKGINEVYSEVASLFDDHTDLLDEFTRFLPDASATASAHHASLRHSYQQYVERSSAGVPLRPGQHDKRVRRERINAERDPGIDCSAQLSIAVIATAIANSVAFRQPVAM